jgi:hypothetical protein
MVIGLLQKSDMNRLALVICAAIGGLAIFAPAMAEARTNAPDASGQEAARDADWTSSQSPETGPFFSHSVGGLTVSLRLLPDEYNMFTPSLEVQVHECAGKEWSASERISPVGTSVDDRAARVREAADGQIAKARQACSFAPDVAPKLLSGIEAAYVKFEEMGR